MTGFMFTHLIPSENLPALGNWYRFNHLYYRCRRRDSVMSRDLRPHSQDIVWMASELGHKFLVCYSAGVRIQHPTCGRQAAISQIILTLHLLLKTLPTVCVLPGCVVPGALTGQKMASHPLDLLLVISCHVGAGIEPGSSGRAAGHLAAEPSLQCTPPPPLRQSLTV